MAEQPDLIRAELSAKLALAHDLGAQGEILDLTIRLAALEVAAGRGGAALPHLKSAERAADRGAGGALERGRIAYIRGQAQARIGGDPLDSFEAATRQFREAGSRVDELRARLRVVETLQGTRRIDEAMIELTAMIGDLQSWGADRGLVDCYRHRASLHVIMARFDEAGADYDRAVAAAERLGEPGLLLRVRLERRAMAPYGDDSAARWEDWSKLIAEAKALGDSAAAGEIRLQQAADALRADDYVEGIKLARAARQAALDATQPVLYLMACLLIAEGREGKGDRAGVIEVLLTCKVTLERAFGRAFAEPVIQVLDSLEPRWGKAAFDDALGRYRAWARARQDAEPERPES